MGSDGGAVPWGALLAGLAAVGAGAGLGATGAWVFQADSGKWIYVGATSALLVAISVLVLATGILLAARLLKFDDDESDGPPTSR